MRVLIDGSAGFLGSHLTDYLLAHGHEVLGVDNLSTGSKDNLRDALRTGLPHFEFLRMPIQYALNAPLYGEKFDVIFHLAAHVGARIVREDPYGLLLDHVEDAKAVVEYATRTGAVLVAASTSEVYGAQPALPYQEMDFCHIGPPTVPRWSYAISKMWVEQLCLAAHRQFGLKVVVPRMFNVSGPRQRADTGMVLPTFAKNVLSGENMTVHGDGMQWRCFSHVADVVPILAALAECPQAIGEVVNVGISGLSLSVLSIAESVNEYCAATYGKRGSVVCVPHSDVDATESMPARAPDTSKLKRLTGLEVPSRWNDLVADVCDYWAGKLGVERKAA
jgi:UDP-glucose 4-epimerase